MLTALCALGAGIAGLLLGYFGALLRTKNWRKTSPDSTDIAKYMTAVVNQEEVEERRRAIRRQFLESGRRSARLDSGPNAKVMRMRKRRKVIVKKAADG